MSRIRSSNGVRAIIADGLAAGACAILLLFAHAQGVFRADPSDVTTTAVLVVGGLALRRASPIIAACVVAIGVIDTSGRLTGVDVAAFAVASFSIADSRLPRWRSLTALTAIASGVGVWFLMQGSSYSIGLSYLASLPAWLLGNAWYERREETARRAAAEREAQEQRVRRAVLDERARLARELHDVVAHEVGVMVVQAGGARQMLSLSPERTRDALVAIEDTGREALAELRQILGMLAETDELAPLVAFQPSLDQVVLMVQRLRNAGLSVALHIDGAERALSDRVWATAYRVVQEGLTNAMKYAGGAPISVVVDFNPDELVVEVVDDGPGIPHSGVSGRGLAGLRERTQAIGGTLEAGPEEGHGFQVRARLPLAQPVEA